MIARVFGHFGIGRGSPLCVHRAANMCEAQAGFGREQSRCRSRSEGVFLGTQMADDANVENVGSVRLPEHGWRRLVHNVELAVKPFRDTAADEIVQTDQGGCRSHRTEGRQRMALLVGIDVGAT